MENRKIKILAIDDTPDNLISLRAQLNDSFPEAIIFTALNGAKGIELAATEDPDMILLDIVMPGMDGYEVCKQLKADEKQSNIPVVFLTAIKGDKESRIRALECGAEALLAKPIDSIELIAQIRAMVKIKAANIDKQNEKERLTQLVEEQVRELKTTHTATLNLLEDLRNEVEIRKQSEANLQESEEHFRAVTQTANDAIVTIDACGNMTGWNNGAERIFGYSEGEIIGKNLTLIMPKQYREQHDHSVSRVAKGEDHRVIGKTTELVGLHQNGTEFPIELSLSEWESSTGKFFTAIIRDISERKQAEYTMREKDIQFQKLMSNVPDLVYQFTRRPDGTFCVPVASEGIRNIYGCSPEDVIDDFAPIARVIYPQDADKVMNEIEISAKNLSPYSCEYRVQIPGQEIKWMHSGSTPELLPDGSVTWYGFNMDITKRKLAEENLKHSEHNLSEAERIGNSGSWDYDVSTGISSWSANMFHIFDVDPEMPTELVFNHFVENLVIPDDRPHILSIFQDALAGKRPYDLEYKTIKKDGSIRTIHAIADTLRDENGNAIHLIGKVEDITERKQAEEALHRNESIHNKMLSNIGDVIVIIDKEGINRYKSSNIEKWFGWKPEDVLGNSTWELLHPDDLVAAQQFVGNLMNEPDSVGTTECRYRCKDGSYKWIEITMMNLMNDPDILGILGNYHDITERKHTELLLQEKTELIKIQNIEYQQLIEELYHTNKQLTEARNKAENNEARLKMAQKISRSGAWEWDILNNTFYWSEEFLQLFGLPENTTAGFESWIKTLHPEDVEIASSKIQEAIENQTELLNDYRIILPDNEIRWIRSTGQVSYVNDKPDKMVGLCMDITLMKEKEIELLDAKDHAEESNRLKSAFLSNMSHEIRTPMNGILGFAELLKEPDLDGEKQQEYIRIIEKSGARMLNIINDIVDISKIESQQMKVSVSVTNVNEKIEYIHTFFKPETDKKGIEFCFKNGLPEIKANILTDKEKIYAILTNLVKNAIKFCDKGAIEIGYDLVETHGLVETLHATSLQNPTMSLQFYVRDTGVGIPKNRQEAIFDRFVQADLADKRAFQGAGLGLSISKAYVEMLGGKIWVESEVEKGSTFFFSLPYQIELAEETPNTPIISAEEALALIKKLNVLIAEDDEASEQFLERVVKRFSHKVFKAKTGFEAVDVCHKNHDIDLILMDIQMPGMDGYEATRQIRQFNKGVVIIAQTAFALSGDSEKARKVGCSDYLAKPIGKEQLNEMIHKHFR